MKTQRVPPQLQRGFSPTFPGRPLRPPSGRAVKLGSGQPCHAAGNGRRPDAKHGMPSSRHLISWALGEAGVPGQDGNLTCRTTAAWLTASWSCCGCCGVCVCASPSSMLLLLRSSFWLVLTTLAAYYATPPLCGTATASTMLSVHVPCPGPRGQAKNQPPRLDSYFSMEPAASRGVFDRDISPFQRGQPLAGQDARIP